MSPRGPNTFWMSVESFSAPASVCAETDLAPAARTRMTMNDNRRRVRDITWTRSLLVDDALDEPRVAAAAQRQRGVRRTGQPVAVVRHHRVGPHTCDGRRVAVDGDV